jgi:hypothetical protein
MCVALLLIQFVVGERPACCCAAMQPLAPQHTCSPSQVLSTGCDTEMRRSLALMGASLMQAMRFLISPCSTWFALMLRGCKQSRQRAHERWDNWYQVCAGVAHPFIKLPVLVAVGSVPLPACIAVLILWGRRGGAKCV